MLRKGIISQMQNIIVNKRVKKSKVKSPQAVFLLKVNETNFKEGYKNRNYAYGDNFLKERNKVILIKKVFRHQGEI